MSEAAIVYDDRCGLCRRTLEWILAWDRRGRLRPVPLDDREADRLLGAMDEGRKRSSWHLVTRDGRVYSAGAAVAPLLRLLPGGRPLAAVAGRFPGLTERAYAWVARHRGRLGAVLGVGDRHGR